MINENYILHFLIKNTKLKNMLHDFDYPTLLHWQTHTVKKLSFLKFTIIYFDLKFTSNYYLIIDISQNISNLQKNNAMNKKNI